MELETALFNYNATEDADLKCSLIKVKFSKLNSFNKVLII